MIHVRPDRRARDQGYTLVEILVAMVIFSVLGSVVLAAVAGGSRAVRTTRTANNINEEARVALNRIARELRQAKEIRAVSAPNGATSITFGVDLDGSGTVDSMSVDPEVMEYRYVPGSSTAAGRIVLTANDAAGVPLTQPILGSQVSAFAISYYSSLYLYDSPTSPDGRVSWQELEASDLAVGAGCASRDGVLNTELRAIDSVVLEFSVLEGDQRQDYRTQVELRNKELGSTGRCV